MDVEEVRHPCPLAKTSRSRASSFGTKACLDNTDNEDQGILQHRYCNQSHLRSLHSLYLPPVHHLSSASFVTFLSNGKIFTVIPQILHSMIRGTPFTVLILNLLLPSHISARAEQYAIYDSMAAVPTLSIAPRWAVLGPFQIGTRGV